MKSIQETLSNFQYDTWYLFDFDGVIANINPKYNDPETIQHFIAALSIRKKRKVPFKAACYILGQEAFHFINEFPKMNHPSPHILNTFKQIKALRYGLGIATNNTNVVIEPWLKHYGLDKYVNIFFCPETLNMLRKPDENYYRAITRRLRVPANGIFFIDDDKENIRGASQVGINGFLHRGKDFKYLELK